MKVLRRAWRGGFTLSCDFARQHVAYVAMCACRGLITTRIKTNVFGRTWHITSIGLQMINASEH